MDVGDTLYHFDTNRRVYAKPGIGGGGPIFAKHFEAMTIRGENRRSWLFDYGMKADKKDPRKHSFYTAEQMADKIWMHENRHDLARKVQDCRDVTLLQAVAEAIGYESKVVENK